MALERLSPLPDDGAGGESSRVPPAAKSAAGGGQDVSAGTSPPTPADFDELNELPGRFQGPAAGRSVGGSGGNGAGTGKPGRKGKQAKSPKSWPTREEREAQAAAKKATQAAEIAKDPTGFARQVCLQLLEFSPRSRKELADALANKGVPEEAAEQVLSRFTEVGMIDDALFASMWVTSRHRGRGLAGRALSQELRRKGVDEELVRAAVEELDPGTEVETARALVRRKLPSTRGLPTEARIRRLAGMLARKGYGAGTAFRVVKEELEREGTDPPDLSFDALQTLDD